MKQTFTFLLFYLTTLQLVAAQGHVEYYQANRTAKAQQKNQLQMRYGPYLAPQWYLMSEGFVRRDNSKADQSLGGLLVTSPVTRVGGSIGGGITYRNKWAIEAGLALSPVHNEARINSHPPVVMLTRSDRVGTFVRGKWGVLTTSRQWHRSGLWLTGGAWALPNRSEATDQLTTVVGYNSYRNHDAVNKMTLAGHTQANRKVVGMAEVGAEYQIRLSPTFDLGLFARKNWGLGEALNTDVAYAVNNRLVGETVVRARGNGASYGLSVRYIFQRPTASGQSVYQLKGNAKRMGN